jgi:hypothetical protein
LLLTAVCASITYIVPIFAGTGTDGILKIFSIRESIILMFLISFVAASSFINIFLFQNRKRQKGIILAASLATIVFILVQYLIVEQFKKDFQVSQGNWEISAILPIFILLFQVFAFLGIRKDEKLLNSADRLR